VLVLASDVINCTLFSTKDRVNILFTEFKEVRERLVVHPLVQSAFAAITFTSPLQWGFVEVAV